MKSIFVTILIILFSLVLIKCNTNNLQFMTGNADVEIYETFINPETNFICEKDDIAISSRIKNITLNARTLLVSGNNSKI